MVVLHSTEDFLAAGRPLLQGKPQQSQCINLECTNDSASKVCIDPCKCIKLRKRVWGKGIPWCCQSLLPLRSFPFTPCPVITLFHTSPSSSRQRPAPALDLLGLAWLILTAIISRKILDFPLVNLVFILSTIQHFCNSTCTARTCIQPIYALNRFGLCACWCIIEIVSSAILSHLPAVPSHTAFAFANTCRQFVSTDALMQIVFNQMNYCVSMSCD